MQLLTVAAWFALVTGTPLQTVTSTSQIVKVFNPRSGTLIHDHGISLTPKTSLNSSFVQSANPRLNTTQRFTGGATSVNWCGAAIPSSGVSYATAIFTVPNLSPRPGTPFPQYGSSWIGIDGLDCGVLFQAGAITELDNDGSQKSYLFWEWFPNAAFKLDGFAASPGDTIEVDISASSINSGTVTVINYSTLLGVIVTTTQPSLPLCLTHAVYIVEAFQINNAQVNFARFSDINFIAISAKSSTSSNLGMDQALGINLMNNNAYTCVSTETDQQDLHVSSQN